MTTQHLESVSSYRIVFQDERPELLGRRNHLLDSWSSFILENPFGIQYWDYLYEYFPKFQFFVLTDDDQIIGEGNTIPFYLEGGIEALPDRGWDDVLERGMIGYRQGVVPNAVSALSATIARDQQGKGISQLILKTMKARTIEMGMKTFVAPVRPSQKALYPLISMERYITWTHDNSGAPFDAWLRTHWRLGARMIRVCPQSMLIRSTIANWETWTKLRFPESGTYVVPGALNPVEMDVPGDQGVYIEPNVWMQHPIEL
jgi:hypothetical protein